MSSEGSGSDTVRLLMDSGAQTETGTEGGGAGEGSRQLLLDPLEDQGCVADENASTQVLTDPRVLENISNIIHISFCCSSAMSEIL